MAINKKIFYGKLWESCNLLRGGMDASQYKDYVLVLLAIKYVTDKAKIDKDFQSTIGELPKEATFDAISGRASNFT